jgi:uncharacterized protein (DUF362 family)
MSAPRPICSLARDEDPRTAVYEALSRLDLPDLTGKRVLLKPNIGRKVPPRMGIDTNPDVTEAVFSYLRERYDADYSIGDSPIIGVKSREAFLASGHGSFLGRSDIRYIDLDARKPLTLKIENGRVLEKVKVSGFLPDFDYIISIPVLKMHMHTGASLGFKNMKGLLYGREKVKLHQLNVPEAKKLYGHKELDLAVADLAEVMEPDLVVCDATYAMEGMGPSAGNCRRLDTVIASQDYLAADVVALAVAGLPIDHVPHLQLIAERRGRCRCLDEITTLPSNIGPFVTDFEVPPTEIVVENNLVRVLDAGSCSACQSSVYLFIKNNEALINEYFAARHQFTIALGNDIEEVPEGTFLIGNCTVKHKDRGTFLVGCPPSQTVVGEVVRAQLEEDR